MSELVNTYRSKLQEEMKWLGEQKDVVFLGQGITKGDRIYHTMDEVPLNKCIEMPIAENLIMGCAIGLSLDGFIPVVIFQRMDFMLIAADQIINHLATMEKMSNGQYKPFVIVRTCIGSQSKKFDVGCQHRNDFREVFRPYLRVGNYQPGLGLYKAYVEKKDSIIIVEEKDKYDETV